MARLSPKESASFLGSLPRPPAGRPSLQALGPSGKEPFKPAILFREETPERKAFERLVGSTLLTLPVHYTPAVACVGLIPRCGTTLVAANLALAVASRGRATLLIDANPSRPSLHKLFGIEPSPGLVEVLEGKATAIEACRGAGEIAEGNAHLEDILLVPGIHRFNLLPYGDASRTPSAPREALPLDAAFRSLRQAYKLLIIDMGALSESELKVLPLAFCDICWLIVPDPEKMEDPSIQEAILRIRRNRLRVGGIIAVEEISAQERFRAAKTASAP
jgi:Mrp family chromosome partitioning ATPase